MLLSADIYLRDISTINLLNVILLLFQSFRAVVDKAGLAGCKRKPVEFLVDRFLGLVEEKEIQIFQVGEYRFHAKFCSHFGIFICVNLWRNV